MRNVILLHFLLLAIPFTFVACIGQSNSKSVNIEEDEVSSLTDSTLVTSSSNTIQNLPSNNMSFGNLFQGGEIEYNVHTGFEEDETAGRWYITNDNEIGGKSNVTFPVPPKSPNYFDENISYCGGFCDTVKIGGNISTPYAGIGFNLVNKDFKGADISTWGGIVIKYVATQHPLTIALIPEGVTDIRQFYHYDLPACPGHRAIRWSDFTQVDEKEHKRNKEDDLKHIAAMQFIVGGLDGDETFIKIISLGTFYLRDNESPHEFMPASSSFYLEPSFNNESSSSMIVNSSDNSSSSSFIALSSSVIYSSSVTNFSSSNIYQSSSSLTLEYSSSSSSNTYQDLTSSSEFTFTYSSSTTDNIESSSSYPPSTSSSMPQWPGFGGGTWGNWR